MKALALWERARPILEDALEHAGGTHQVEDVLGAIAEGKLQLWLGERCAGVTEILTFPRKRMLNLFLAGGDLDELQALKPGVEAYARAHACDGVMFSGRMTGAVRRRAGWSRASTYTPTHICFTKELA